VSPDPNTNSFLIVVALFTSVYFSLTAMIPAAYVIRFLLDGLT
jgi:hypothetical protein